MGWFNKKEKEKTAEKWILEGNSLRGMERYDEAIVCYDKALELDPEDLDASELKGYLLRDLHRYDEAITCFDKALKINPEDPDVWANKGNSLIQLQKHDEAIVCFDKALELNPMHDKAWLFKGVSLFGLDKYDDAIACYDKAQQIEPENSAYVSELKEMILRSEKQVEYFTKALEIEPHVVIRWIAAGQALINNGRYEEAITYCNKAQEIDPENASSWNIKGIALQNLDRIDEARKCYEKAIELDSDYDSAKKNLKILKSELSEDDEKSNKHINEDDEKHSNFLKKINPDLYLELINLFDKFGENKIEPSDVINILEKRIREYPNDYSNKSIILYFMGRINESIGDDIKSLELYDKALELEPNNIRAWEQKGLKITKDEPYEALKCIDKCIELHEEARFWYYKGIILANLDEHNEAINCLSKALEVEFEYMQDWHYNAWYQKGISLFELNEYEKAIPCFNPSSSDSNPNPYWSSTTCLKVCS